jgi:hypothetical protein
VSLEIRVLDVAPEPWAAVPTMRFRLQLTEPAGHPIHAIALQCQIRFEPHRRRDTHEEQARLLELFGLPEQWTTSRRPFPWLTTSLVVNGFTGVTEVDLAVACTYDLDVVATKYLHALDQGVVPLLLLFSGTVFSRGVEGFQAERIGWDTEARFAMPVSAWRELMDLYYPNSGWLRLDRPTLLALQRFKAARGLPTWEQAMGALLDAAGEVRT